MVQDKTPKGKPVSVREKILFSDKFYNFITAVLVFSFLEKHARISLTKLYGLSKNQHLENRATSVTSTELYGLTCMEQYGLTTFITPRKSCPIPSLTTTFIAILSSSKAMQVYRPVQYRTIQNFLKFVLTFYYRLPQSLCQVYLDICAKIYWEMCPLQILEISKIFSLWF